MTFHLLYHKVQKDKDLQHVLFYIFLSGRGVVSYDVRTYAVYHLDTGTSPLPPVRSPQLWRTLLLPFRTTRFFCQISILAIIDVCHIYLPFFLTLNKPVSKPHFFSHSLGEHSFSHSLGETRLKALDRC